MASSSSKRQHSPNSDKESHAPQAYSQSQEVFNRLIEPIEDPDVVDLSNPTVVGSEFGGPSSPRLSLYKQQRQSGQYSPSSSNHPHYYRSPPTSEMSAQWQWHQQQQSSQFGLMPQLAISQYTMSPSNIQHRHQLGQEQQQQQLEQEQPPSRRQQQKSPQKRQQQQQSSQQRQRQQYQQSSQHQHQQPSITPTQDLLIKQGRQLKAIYELMKVVITKTTAIEEHLKQAEEKKVDLSKKVWAEGYTAVCTNLFPENPWPTFEQYKTALEEWLNEKHTEYLRELGNRQWTNVFTGQHHSAIIKRMKDIRGVNATAVRNAIFRIFGLKSLPSMSRKKNAKEISEWKDSREVAQCYQKLYTYFTGETTYINHIARTAFPVLSEETLSTDHCIYTAAVCDIVLNPRYPDIECKKAPLKRRIDKFKAIYESNCNPTQEDSAAILDEETREEEAQRGRFEDEEDERLAPVTSAENVNFSNYDDYFDID